MTFLTRSRSREHHGLSSALVRPQPMTRASRGLVKTLKYYTTDVDAFLEAVPKVGVRLKEAGCKPSSTLLGVTRLADPEWMIEIEATAVG
jgi:enamine deaminase RidA (YjgF/YER057c/UK114 family)